MPDDDMPTELSDRLQASDAMALTPLYQRQRRPIYRFALLW